MFSLDYVSFLVHGLLILEIHDQGLFFCILIPCFLVFLFVTPGLSCSVSFLPLYFLQASWPVVAVCIHRRHRSLIMYQLRTRIWHYTRPPPTTGGYLSFYSIVCFRRKKTPLEASRCPRKTICMQGTQMRNTLGKGSA